MSGRWLNPKLEFMHPWNPVLTNMKLKEREEEAIKLARKLHDITFKSMPDNQIDEDGELKSPWGHTLTIRELEERIQKLNDPVFYNSLGNQMLWYYEYGVHAKEDAIKILTKLLNKRKERKKLKEKNSNKDK